MTRRFETRCSRGRALALPLGRGLCSGLLLAVIACQSNAAPSVGSEPRRADTPALASPAAAAEPAPSSAATQPPASAAPAAPTGAAAAPTVGLAKFEEPAAVRSVAPSAGASTSAGAPAAPTAGEPAQQGKTVQGPVVSDEPFSAWLQASSPLKAGSPATIEAVLVAKPPYHCNAEYPHKFKLGAPPAGISFPEATVKGMRVSAERSVLPIPVQAQSPGKAKVTGTLSFSVCDDERCLVEKRELELELEVK